MTVIISISGEDEEIESDPGDVTCEAKQSRQEDEMRADLRLVTVWESIQSKGKQYSPSHFDRIRS